VQETVTLTALGSLNINIRSLGDQFIPANGALATGHKLSY